MEDEKNVSEEKPRTAKPNYPGNSHKSKAPDVPEKKKEEKIVDGQVKQRKKPLGRRIAETFTGDDIRSVGHYILFEVFIPAAKTMLSDAASQGVERMLFGEQYRPRSGISGGRVAYNRISQGATRSDLDRPGTPRQISQRGRANHEFDEVILESRPDAEEVLERLGDIIDKYDFATVTDLYDMVGITGSFTDDKWGWSDLRSAGVRRVSGGYTLNLPRTEPIN